MKYQSLDDPNFLTDFEVFLKKYDLWPEDFDKREPPQFACTIPQESEVDEHDKPLVRFILEQKAGKKREIKYLYRKSDIENLAK